MVRKESDEAVSELIKNLERKLGFKFSKEKHIKVAITRASYKNEFPDINRDHNERMEFLGDSVLKMILSEHLYSRPDDPESKMTEIRAKIEKNDTLALIARELGIKDHLLLSIGEKTLGPPGNNKVLADTLEAIIGAMYLDSGYEKTRNFVKDKMLMTLLHTKLDEN